MILCGQVDLSFLWIGLLPVEYDNMADLLHQRASTTFRQLLRQLLSLFFQRVEFYFHQFLVIQRLIEAGNHGVGQAGLPEMNRGLKALAESPQVGNLLCAKGAHWVSAPRVKNWPPF